MQSMSLAIFSRNSSFTSHLKIHSGEKQNTFQVKTNHSSQCEYPSSGNSNLTSHFKIHSEDKPNQWNVT